MRDLVIASSGLAALTFCVTGLAQGEVPGPVVEGWCTSWLSPDGSKFMYVDYSREAGHQLWVLDADGSNPVLRMGPEPGRVNISGADWSPDSRRIVYSVRSHGDPDRCCPSSFSLSIVDIVTDEHTAMEYTLSDDEGPRWSPDGSLIVYTMWDWDATEGGEGFNDIFVIRPDGTGRANLTNHVARDFAPAWSPDGTKIAFASHREDEWGDIFVMDSDGSNPVNLTLDGRKSQDINPSWSPDGSLIVFTRIGKGIFVTNSDGTSLRQVSHVDDRDPACFLPEWWSIDTVCRKQSWGGIKSTRAR